MTILLSLALLALQDGPPPFEPPVLVPPPLRVEPRFAPFTLPEGARVVASNPALVAEAGVLAGHLARLTGRELVPVEGPARAGDVILSTGGSILADLAGEEGFAIEVFGDHIAVMGKGAAGVSRGGARLLQLVQLEDGAVTFPPVAVVDEPRYPWRGLFLDGMPRDLADGERDPLAEAIEAAYLLGWNRVVVRDVWDGAFVAAGGRRAGLFGSMFLELVPYEDLAAARGIVLVPEVGFEGRLASVGEDALDLGGSEVVLTPEGVAAGSLDVHTAWAASLARARGAEPLLRWRCPPQPSASPDSGTAAAEEEPLAWDGGIVIWDRASPLSLADLAGLGVPLVHATEGTDAARWSPGTTWADDGTRRVLPDGADVRGGLAPALGAPRLGELLQVSTAVWTGSPGGAGAGDAVRARIDALLRE